MINPGSGYVDALGVAHPPTVTITGIGSGATATAIVPTYGPQAGTVTEFLITNAGSGYTTAPTVTVSGGSGSGAQGSGVANVKGLHYVGANSPGDFQINPNLAVNPNNPLPAAPTSINAGTLYLQTFFNILSQGGTNYESNPTDASYALTANLLAALDPANLNNPVPDAMTNGSGVTYYPLKLQPFFKEVSATIVYTADASGNVATPGTPDGYLVVELGNPFTVAVDLRNFYIGVNNSNVLPTLYKVLPTGTCDDSASYVILPGGHVIIYSQMGSGDVNDADIKTSVQGLETVNPSPYTVAGGTGFNWTSLINSATPLVLTLAYQDTLLNTVVVDRMTSIATFTPGSNQYPNTNPAFAASITTAPSGASQTTNWPPVPLSGSFTYTLNPATPSGRLVISASLERDDTSFDPFASDGTPPFSKEPPHYIYENPTYNLVETASPVGIGAAGTAIPIQNRMSFANQGIKSIRITDPGSGYTGVPTIGFSPSLGGPTATANIANGQVISFSLTATGTYPYIPTGYAGTYPQVTFTGEIQLIGGIPVGMPATAIAGVGQKLANYVGGPGGAGGLPSPLIFQVAVNGTAANLTPATMPAPFQLSAPMGSIPSNILNTATGLSPPPAAAPSVVISAPNLFGGVQATAVASVNPSGTISAISVTNPGSGYLLTSVNIGPPNVVGGTQANAIAIITAGGVASYQITNSPSGYTSPPAVTFSAPNLVTSGAQATTTSPAVSSLVQGSVITVTTPGTGYAPNPTITIGGTPNQLVWNSGNPGVFRTVGDMAMLMTYTNLVNGSTWTPISATLMTPYRVATDQGTINLARLHFDAYGRTDAYPGFGPPGVGPPAYPSR